MVNELHKIVDRKFTESIDISEWEVETESGWKDIEKLNVTVPYEVWKITLEDGKSLRAADTHILIDENSNEIFLKDGLNKILKTKQGTSKVTSVENLKFEQKMYDLTVNSDNHTYYTNDILSHNTTVAAGYLLWYATFVPDSTILVASKSGSDSKEIMIRIRYAYEELPDHIRAGARDYNKGSITFDNGSRIISTTTTENTGRGMSISLIYLDEFAFVPPRVAKELWTSLSPTLSTGGKIIVTSTPNSDEDQFAQLWFDANKLVDEYGNERDVGINGFKPYMAIWSEHPDRDEKWAIEERSKIGSERFGREHECKFIVFEETLINSSKLAKLEGSPPIRKAGEVRWYEEIKRDATYVVSLDPSMGTGGDNSAIQVWELPALKQVAEWQHNKTPIEGQMRVLRQILREISANGSPEIYWSIETNAMGEAALVVLRHEGEENYPGTMLHDPRPDVGTKNRRKGFITSSKVKLEACVRLKSLIENEKMGIKSRNLIGELKNFIAKGNTYEARIGSTDDLVMSTILFIRMAQYIAGWDDSCSNALNQRSSDSEEGDEYSQPMPVVFL